MAEHIDRTQLQRDLRYRFDYLSKFLNFNKDEITLLNILAPMVSPHIPSIVEKVYRKLYFFDATKDYFLIHNDEFTSTSSFDETDVSVLSTQTHFRQDMLRAYLNRLFYQTEWTDSHLQYLSHVGEIHANEQPIVSTNVSYIHINCLMGYLENLFIDLIWKLSSLELKSKWQSVRAINHLFRIQNDLFTMHYGISFKDAAPADTP